MLLALSCQGDRQVAAMCFNFLDEKKNPLIRLMVKKNLNWLAFQDPAPRPCILTVTPDGQLLLVP